MAADPIDALFPAHLAALRGVAEHALAATDCEALVIGAGRAHVQYLDDQPYPFKPNPHFRQWVPVADAPGSCVVVAPGRRPTLVFHQPEDYWHKPPELPEGTWLREFELVVVRSADAARQHVPARAAWVGERFPGIEEWGFAAIDPQPLLDRLHYARARKSDYELACLRRAAALGARAHVAAEQAFRAGASEYEIHLEYLRATGHLEAELPYPNIIALNAGAAVLHYTELQRRRPARHLSCLIDAGAQYRGYACDITRTHVAAAGEFADLVRALDEVQQRLCAAILPGVEYPSVHLAAHREIGALLAGAGLVRCSAEAAVETGLTAVFFPHGIGHLLGLQVHDAGGHLASEDGGTLERPPGHPYLRLTRRLEPGTVVTVEPGIYFVDLLLAAAHGEARGRAVDWDAVERLRPYGGVRIEDDVVAGAAGAENLTRDAFAALA